MKISTASVLGIETLNRNNYDTWKIQVEVKNDAWIYVNGESRKPQLNAEDEH